MLTIDEEGSSIQRLPLIFEYIEMNKVFNRHQMENQVILPFLAFVMYCSCLILSISDVQKSPPLHMSLKFVRNKCDEKVLLLQIIESGKLSHLRVIKFYHSKNEDPKLIIIILTMIIIVRF